LAWGAVPNTEKILNESANDVIDRIRDGIALLEKSGVDRADLTEKMLVTPACGCANMAVEQCESVYKILAELQTQSGANMFGS